MKNLKKLIPVAAFVLGIGLVFTQSAFKSASSLKTYQYDDNTSANLFDRMAWIDLDVEEAISCTEGDDLPCTVQFDTSEYADIDAFLTANNTPTLIATSGRVVEEKAEVAP